MGKVANYIATLPYLSEYPSRTEIIQFHSLANSLREELIQEYKEKYEYVGLCDTGQRQDASTPAREVV